MQGRGRGGRTGVGDRLCSWDGEDGAVRGRRFPAGNMMGVEHVWSANAPYAPPCAPILYSVTADLGIPPLSPRRVADLPLVCVCP